MRTEKREIQVGQKIILADGSIDRVDDFDGSFYYMENSDECFREFSIVNVVIG